MSLSYGDSSFLLHRCHLRRRRDLWMGGMDKQGGGLPFLSVRKEAQAGLK